MSIFKNGTDESETESESSEESSSVDDLSDSDSSSPESKTSDESDNDSKNPTITLAVLEATARNVNLKPKEEYKDAVKLKGRPKPGVEKGLTICLSNCRYEIVRGVAKSFGLHEVPQDKIWDIFWTDFSISLARAIDMKKFQIVNHFPGMNEICRKDLLSNNLNRMKKLFPDDYDIFPKTWCLPSEMEELQAYGETWKNKTFICKPEMGCQGKGIFLLRNLKDLNPFGRIICQVYISKPFLIDGLKFDMRVYVLITSCDPLRIYVYNEGLARFATSKYMPPTNNNTDNSYMHLTNYSVNKFSRDYVIDEELGTKRKLTSLYRWFRTHSFDEDDLIRSIDDVIIKTIISAQPILKHNYKKCYHNHDRSSACFEILGFDILFDHKLKPFVLEVNHSPSFHTDSKMDLEIKENLIKDTFRIVNLKEMYLNKFEHFDKENIQDLKGEAIKEAQIARAEAQLEYELENCGEYRLAYPTLRSRDKYSKFFDQHVHPIVDTGVQANNKVSNSLQTLKNSTLEDANKMREEERKKQVLASALPGAGVSALNKFVEKTHENADQTIDGPQDTPDNVDETVKTKQVDDSNPDGSVNFAPPNMLTPNEMEAKNAVMLADLKESEKEEKLLANEKIEEEKKKLGKRKKVKKSPEKKTANKNVRSKALKSQIQIEKPFGIHKLPYPTASSLNHTITPDMNLTSHKPVPIVVVVEEEKEMKSPFIKVTTTPSDDNNLTRPKGKLAAQKSQQLSSSNWKTTRHDGSYELGTNKLTSLPTMLINNTVSVQYAEVPPGDSLALKEKKEKTIDQIFTLENIETHYDDAACDEKLEPQFVKSFESDNEERYFGEQAEKNLTKVWSAYGSTFGNTSVQVEVVPGISDQSLKIDIPPPTATSATEEEEIVLRFEENGKRLSQEILAFQERAYIEWKQSEKNNKKKLVAQVLQAKKQAAASQHDLFRQMSMSRMTGKASNYSNTIEEGDEFERMKELRRRAMYVKSRGIESTSLLVLAKAGLLKTKDSRRLRKINAGGIVNPIKIRPVPSEVSNEILQHPRN